MAGLSLSKDRVFQIPKEQEGEIDELSKERLPNPAAIRPDDLKNNQKRWLVVGIALHSIVTPILRPYAKPVVKQLHDDLKLSDKIDTQTFLNFLETYPPTKKKLNYKAINGNKGIPPKSWGYVVRTAVDLSKLFLPTRSTHYSGFDHTCDLSSLLGILISIDRFPSAVRNDADKIRQDIRNPWGHCDFNDWDSAKYTNSFRIMESFVKSLALDPDKEISSLGQLAKWEHTGTQFFQGTTLGLEVLHELRNSTVTLAKYTSTVMAQSEKEFTKINSSIENIAADITSTIERVGNLEKNVAKQSTKINALCKDVNKLKDKIKIILDYANPFIKVEEMLGMCPFYIILAMAFAIFSVFALYRMIEDVEDRLFFYLPYRIEWFEGRETELANITEVFRLNYDKHFVQIVCGLGAIGKSTFGIEYAWRSKSFYPGGILWMSAKSEHSSRMALLKLAVEVNITGNSQEETMNKTLNMLSHIKRRWLLILDNVDEETISSLNRDLLFESFKDRSRAHIIITTRRRQSEAEEAFRVKPEQCIKFNPFSEAESINFMVKRSQQNTDNTHVLKELVAVLGYLPLALEQAAVHIKVTRCTYEEYFDMIKKVRNRLTYLRKANYVHDSDENRHSVQTTWQINIDYIRKHSFEEGLGTAAITAMEAMSFIDGVDIPPDVLNIGDPVVCDLDLRLAMRHPAKVKHVIEILTRFSLFDRNEDGKLSVHPLVQEIIRDNIMFNNRTDAISQCTVRMITFAKRKLTSYAGVPTSSITPSKLPTPMNETYSRYKHKRVKWTGNPDVDLSLALLCNHAYTLIKNLYTQFEGNEVKFSSDWFCYTPTEIKLGTLRDEPLLL